MKNPSTPEYVYRIPPCWKYDIAGMESWLEDMAGKGYFLTRDGVSFGIATFCSEPARAVRYRLEATATNGGIFSSQADPEEEAVAFHRDMGWDYCGRWGQFWIYRCEDPLAPELHTDPLVQALTFRGLTRLQRHNFIGSLCSLLLNLFLYNVWFFPAVLTFGVGTIGLLFGDLLGLMTQRLLALRSTTRAKRALEEGKSLSHHRDYRKDIPRVWVWRGIKTVCSIVTVIMLFTTWASSLDEKPRLEDWTEPLPFPLVEELLPEGAVGESTEWIPDTITSWSNWISPVNLDCYQYRWVTLEDASYLSFSMEITYHETRFIWFARGLCRDFGNTAVGSPGTHLLFPRQRPQALDGTGWDEAYYIPGRTCVLVLRQDTTVLQIRYSQSIEVLYSPEELAQVMLKF